MCWWGRQSKLQYTSVPVGQSLKILYSLHLLMPWSWTVVVLAAGSWRRRLGGCCNSGKALFVVFSSSASSQQHPSLLMTDAYHFLALLFVESPCASVDWQDSPDTAGCERCLLVFQKRKPHMRKASPNPILSMMIWGFMLSVFYETSFDLKYCPLKSPWRN